MKKETAERLYDQLCMIENALKVASSFIPSETFQSELKDLDKNGEALRKALLSEIET